MRYGYYPGCSLHATAEDYHLSITAVCESLKIELNEISDWICCGATPAHQASHLLSIALPMTNLNSAQKQGIDRLIVPCSACFSRFKSALFEIRNNNDLREKIEEILESPFEDKIEVEHIINIFSNGVNLAEKVVNKLKGLKIACYYGCLLTRPPKILDLEGSCEDPTFMEDLINALGGECVSWPYKTECCGAAAALTKTEVVIKLCGDILKKAHKAKAEIIVVACPLCQSNLDVRQKAIKQKYSLDFEIPILYITQVVGIALGIEKKKLGLNKQMVSPIKLLKEKGLI